MTECDRKQGSGLALKAGGFCLLTENAVSISFIRFKCHLTVAAYKSLSQSDLDLSKVPSVIQEVAGGECQMKAGSAWATRPHPS